MTKQTKHQSILVSEVLKGLNLTQGGTYLDATFGGGGHTKAILEAEPSIKVVGIDRDETTSEFAADVREQFAKRFSFVPISYTKVSELNQKFDGALMDLGISSDQLDTPAGGSGRGFSFKNSDDPLDLRFDATDGLTAAQFLNRASIKELEHVFRDFAEDRYWRGLSARIIENRKNVRIETVNDFIALVGNGSPTVLAPLFQALRIQVNQELENLDLGLTEVSKVLKVGAVLAVISFHSLEDRIVKHFFRTDAWEILTKKPIAPSHQEITRNPRSRSAKLRIARLILLESGIS